MKKSLFLCAALFLCSGLRAQTDGCLRRIVVDSLRQPLDCFNVLISDPADSALLFGEACFHGRFEVPAQGSGPRIVTLRSLGFRDLSFLEDFARPSSPDTLVMAAASVGIGEVVVRAAAPPLSVSAGRTLVQVAGSSLQHLVDVADILRRAPGLEADESGLTVLGKGEPLIFIDDRRSSYAELRMLRPSQILSLEIDRSPSARYDAAYKAVVRVRTKRARDGFSGQIANVAYMARRFGDLAAASVQWAGGKWVHYLSCDYYHRYTHSRVSETHGILLPGRELVDTVRADWLFVERSPSVLYGTTFDISSRHRLSWQYAGLFRNDRIDHVSQEQEYRGGAVSDYLESSASQVLRRARHAAHLAYRWAVDSVRTFSVEADYTHVVPRGSQCVQQFRPASGEAGTLRIANRSRSGVFAAKSEFAAPLWGADWSAGVHYGRIDSRTFSDFDGSPILTRLSSDNLSVYTALGRKYAKWGWQAGLRGEFQNDRVRVGGVLLRSGWENRCFPSARLFTTSGLFRDFEGSVSYTSRVSRPSVGSLDPSLFYVNDMVCERGNPLLRSAVSHSLEFIASFRGKLTLTVDVDFRFHSIIQTGVLDDDGQRILFQPVNVDRSRFSTVDLTYSDRWGRFSLTLDAGMEFSRARIPYMDGTIAVGRPAWYAGADCDLEIGKNTFLTCGFRYYGRSYELMTTFEAKNNLSAGITQYCFGRRLQLSLPCNDLLRGMTARWF
ncbi:MAG: outer membrane beta-barrel protein, partial [Alistipes sp.]|nr:outer membrane beta-barrel protein [Alistipes sp.]